MKVITLLSRSESSRPRVIGWSPSRRFWRLKTRRVSLPSELFGSPTAPVLRFTPNRFARHWAAEPIGAWSVISNKEPPPWTQSRTASHSASVNAGFEASSWPMPAAPRALAMTRMSPLCRTSRANFSLLGMTR